ncbi:ATP-binding protein [Streptomyces sp. NBC_00006]|uniref:ATP-binding protein n=1 Tax=unclassified Streptomyces TaxID=2593676 RepID=UPI00225B0A4B|nr:MULTISPECIES: ATP-binding protein [unclassified Streptomyces]MCX5533489.1 ATP-binding protein [Streptomyces sp. NBC_00006]
MTTVSPLPAGSGLFPGTYALQLPHDPRAPGIARALLRMVLEAHGKAELVEPAELLSSELLTNAHLHTTGPYTLRLGPGVADPGRVRVAVWDGDPKIPPGFERGGPRADACAEGGRGLFLVRAYADDWGAYSFPDGRGGKLLWAECGGADRPGSGAGSGADLCW